MTNSTRFVLTTLAITVLAPYAHAHEAIRAEFTTDDGVQIVGDYWTPIDMSKPAPAVVLLHMYRADRSTWKPLIVALEYAGFAILAIDMRGHGESTEPAEMQLFQRVFKREPALFNDMHRDVAGAYQWLAQRPEVDLSRFVLVGASVGCSVALDYARRDKSVDAVALMSPGTDYLGVDSLAHIAAYGKRAILMLTSEREEPKGAGPLGAAGKKADVAVEQEVYANDAHGTNMFGAVKDADKRIAEFLKKQVGATTGPKVYASVGGSVYYAKGDPAIAKMDAADVRVFGNEAEAKARGLKPAK